MSKPTYPKSHWSKRHSYVSRTKLREAIGAYSTQPFADAVAFLLGCRPDSKSIYEWAQKNPDKWANAISIFAKLQGFAEYKVIDHNHHLDIGKMSDAEITQRLEDLRLRASQPNGSITSTSELEIIEGQVLSIGLEKVEEKPPEKQSSLSEG